MKVNLGCGGSTPAGWLNVDFGPGAKLSKVPILRHVSKRVLRHEWDASIFIHDLRKPLPWTGNTVGKIYSSHTLEHLTRSDGERLIFETFRVLKPGGILRIVVPDLGYAVARYTSDELGAPEFLPMLSAVDTKSRSFSKRVFSMLAGSGHRCMYDVKSLIELMERAGFAAKQMPPFESAIGDIADIERRDRTEHAAIVEGIKSHAH